jgi:GNAT superfamily N-acetyltransferase
VSSDDYELDDDPLRVDLAVVSHFLTTEAYWGRWRGRAEIERQLATAWRVVGAYERTTGAMVGFARAVSDGVAVGYLADVFVQQAHRGRGVGDRLVRAMVDSGPATMRWMLHTADAHDLYARHGFQPPDGTYLERPARLREESRHLTARRSPMTFSSAVVGYGELQIRQSTQVEPSATGCPHEAEQDQIAGRAAGD